MNPHSTALTQTLRTKDEVKRRAFGRGPEVSLFTLGTMRALDSEEQMHAVVKAALSSGINHIETAHGYIKSENLFGFALKELGVPRKKFKLMTKGAPMSGNEARKLVEEQLEALKLDYIDFYGWHGINNKELLKVAVEKNGPVETLHKLKEEGLIRHIGFSTHGPLKTILEAMQTNLFSFVNLHYYYFFHTVSIRKSM